MEENRSLFQFKKFSLEHGNPGLKITTEACLFGSILANFPATNVLDIGTGSGLLAFMYAQKNENSRIDAIEIDYDVSALAQKNVLNFPYKNQIQILWGDIESFEFPGKFDLIFSNPPFFFDHLKSSNPFKNIAMHSGKLKPKNFIKIIQNLLSPDGKIFILYPEKEMEKFIEFAKEEGFYLNHIWEIWTKQEGKILRMVGLFSKRNELLKKEILPIKTLENEYSPEFKNYLKDYYLIF